MDNLPVSSKLWGSLPTQHRSVLAAGKPVQWKDMTIYPSKNVSAWIDRQEMLDAEHDFISSASKLGVLQEEAVMLFDSVVWPTFQDAKSGKISKEECRVILEKNTKIADILKHQLQNESNT